MLVLTRKPKDAIQIGDQVLITVLEIQGNRVRIGIDAPKKVRVLRTELLNVITEPPTASVAAAGASKNEGS